jgi:hypothetical protein
MAKLIGSLLSGIIGPYKFSIRNGKQIVSKKITPGTMKQSKATKAVSQVFGRASSLGAKFRKTLAIQYFDLFNADAINGLNRLMFPLLNRCRDVITGQYSFEVDSFSALEKFEFNLNSKVSSMMSKIPVISLNGNVLKVMLLQLSVPRDFKFPGRDIRCEIRVALSLFRLHDGFMVALAESQGIMIMKQDGIAGPHDFSFDVPAGTLCIVTLFLDYYTANKVGWVLIKDRTFSPGCICGAVITPGTNHQDDNRRWTKIPKFI